MAKRRRGFDRRPAQPQPRAGSAQWRAASTTPDRRRGVAVLLTIGAVAAIVVIAFVGGAGGAGPSATGTTGATLSPSAPAPSAAPTPTIGGVAPAISGVQCDVDEGTTYHVHAHLNIRIDGQLYLPPAGVGILPTCLYWLHTHQGQGVIHIEAPSVMTFTLGQFFDVWGQPLSTTQVLAAGAVGEGRSLYMFIDGQPYSGDPRAIQLRDLESIELQVGREPLDPLPYTFPADL